MMLVQHAASSARMIRTYTGECACVALNQPLGMTHSALERNAQMLPHLSKGYQVMGPNGGVDSETPHREHETGRGYKVPNGAIYTTVGDLAHFASFLMGQGPENVLKIASLERF